MAYDGLCGDWFILSQVTAYTGLGDLTPDEVFEWAAPASGLLYILTGRRWSGPCDTSIRPFGPQPIQPASMVATYRTSGYPYYPNGQHYVPTSCRCGRCNNSIIELGYAPINSITWVVIDGDTLDEDQYRLDDKRWLVRIDGSSWPLCQDLNANVGSDNTFEVRFSHGDFGGVRARNAAIQLAMQMAKAAKQDPTCLLPAQAIGINRQGVNVTMDPTMFTEKGLTGIATVDTFIHSVNPNQLQRRARVGSPDMPRPTSIRS